MKIKTLLTSIAILLLVGCASVPTTTTHNIPNFRVVDVSKSIYRGGQPSDTNSFVYLKSLGVTNIVKLNTESEGSDEEAQNYGMKVIYDPIFTSEQLLHTPMWKVDMAVTNIVPGTYVHCEHGQDRTGLVIADYEIKNGKSKANAEKEMLADGFHKSLFGLWECFENLK